MLILAVLFLLAVYGLVMAMWPRLGTIILITTIFLWPDYIVWVSGGGSGPGINPQRVLVPFTAAIFILHLLSAAKYRQSFFEIVWSHRFLMSLIVLFFALGVVSGLLSSMDVRRATLAAVNHGVWALLPMVLVLTFFTQQRHVLTLVWLILICAFFAQLVGMLELWMGRLPFEAFIDPSSNYAEEVLEGKSRFGRRRVTSVFGNPLTYAQFLVCITPLIIYQYLTSRTLALRVFSALMFFLVPISVYTTASRSALGLLALVYPILGLYWIHKRLKLRAAKRLLVIAGGLGVVVGFAGLVYLMAVGAIMSNSGATDASTASRFSSYVFAVPAIVANPMLGNGVLQATIGYIDNYYLSTILERGVVGLGLLLISQLVILIYLLRLFSNPYLPKSLTLLAGLVAISCMQYFIFELVLSIPENQFTVYLLLALVMSMERAVRQGQRVDRVQPVPSYGLRTGSLA